MAKHAIIDDATGNVDNVIEWDGVTPLDFPGKTLRTASDVSPGDTWDGTKYVKKPPPPEPPPTPVQLLQAELDAVKARLDVTETKVEAAETKIVEIEDKLPKP